MTFQRLATPSRALPFLSCLFQSEEWEDNLFIKEAKSLLGPALFFYHSFFPMKDYYSKEMGESQHLKRFFAVSLEKTIFREELVSLKLKTETLEEKYRTTCRGVNFDPGIICLENLVLATCKAHGHRIYLNQGVYAELTYIFEDGSYRSLPWTYPDYSHTDLIDFFNRSRQILKFLLY